MSATQDSASFAASWKSVGSVFASAMLATTSACSLAESGDQVGPLSMINVAISDASETERVLYREDLPYGVRAAMQRAVSFLQSVLSRLAVDGTVDSHGMLEVRELVRSAEDEAVRYFLHIGGHRRLPPVGSVVRVMGATVQILDQLHSHEGNQMAVKGSKQIVAGIRRGSSIFVAEIGAFVANHPSAITPSIAKALVTEGYKLVEDDGPNDGAPPALDPTRLNGYQNRAHDPMAGPFAFGSGEPL